MNEPTINIAPSDRVLIIGTSGSGKSYLTRRVLLPRYAMRPVVLDPKERWDTEDNDWRGHLAEVVDTFHPGGHPYQVIRLPEYDERDGPDLWDEQVAAILREGGHTIIVDELTLVTNPLRLPRSLGRAVRTGRDYKRGSVGVWMLTQQPVHIPTVTYALANHKFLFMQEREDDEVRLTRETTRDILPYLNGLRQGDYLYYNKERRLLVPVWAHEPE